MRDAIRTVRKQNQEGRRGQSESTPRGQCAEVAGAHEAQREPELARCRSRQELTKAHEVRVGTLADPLATRDELVPEVSKVRDRPTETGASEPRKNAQHLESRALSARAGRGTLNRACR